MKRTTLLTLAVLAGWAVTAAAQTPTPAEPSKARSIETKVQKRTEVSAREQVEAPSTGQRLVDTGQAQGKRNGAANGGQGRGPGDGTGNQGVGPRDGSGRGAGLGNCTGTGSRGSRGSGRRGGGGRH